jgi:predicted phosphodiesterase
MKKILVISDAHGRTKNLEKILPKVQPVDYLFHLGDVGRDADYIEVIAEKVTFLSSENKEKK